VRDVGDAGFSDAAVPGARAQRAISHAVRVRE